MELTSLVLNLLKVMRQKGDEPGSTKREKGKTREKESGQQHQRTLVPEGVGLTTQHVTHKNQATSTPGISILGSL